MPRHYTDDQKSAAFQILDSTYGDIALTSSRTGIPERTLRDWRRERQRSSPPSPPPNFSPPPPPNVAPEFEDDLDAVTYIREQIMGELLNVSANIQDTFAQTPPEKRLRVLSDLLDRLMSLDQMIQPYQRTPWYRFQWDVGLYVRTPTERHGPFTPEELPKRWREVFGEECLLEIYWGYNTATVISEGALMDELLNTYEVEDNNESPQVKTSVENYWENPDWRDQTDTYELDNGVFIPRSHLFDTLQPIGVQTKTSA